ncbi:hypothetical protein BABINDRAFT_160469 [Babjeviella inositovora NRRL Y-12698]|uniref:Uncharacterized protein n=1 Tax=Babjeviella inositovora NRRL Y-12698 TaxID=984486 RepID=A0A1E3QVF1_9ASCO|nr:uncharacterized protein BABINDRAFT_160469 [Babjeviella inositovora NRRL Y-12698]ODQ81052.1 hypothetical protein BABINDRAFT_160469 [Babjeviella inositovora NRRL Y-12698]
MFIDTIEDYTFYPPSSSPIPPAEERPETPTVEPVPEAAPTTASESRAKTANTYDEVYQQGIFDVANMNNEIPPLRVFDALPMLEEGLAPQTGSTALERVLSTTTSNDTCHSAVSRLAPRTEFDSAQEPSDINSNSYYLLRGIYKFLFPPLPASQPQHSHETVPLLGGHPHEEYGRPESRENEPHPHGDRGVEPLTRWSRYSLYMVVGVLTASLVAYSWIYDSWDMVFVIMRAIVCYLGGSSLTMRHMCEKNL